MSEERRPSIADLEAMMEHDGEDTVTILPDGTVERRQPEPRPLDAVTRGRDLGGTY